MLELIINQEVDKKIIMYLIKEGRLIIDSPDGEGGGLLHCESCKKPVKTGRLCGTCAEKISSKMNRGMSDDKPAAQRDSGPSIKGSAKIAK